MEFLAHIKHHASVSMSVGVAWGPGFLFSVWNERERDKILENYLSLDSNDLNLDAHSPDKLIVRIKMRHESEKQKWKKKRFELGKWVSLQGSSGWQIWINNICISQ